MRDTEACQDIRPSATETRSPDRLLAEIIGDTEILSGRPSNAIARTVSSLDSTRYPEAVGWMQSQAIADITRNNDTIDGRDRTTLARIQADIAMRGQSRFDPRASERASRSIARFAPDGSRAAGLIATTQRAADLASGEPLARDARFSRRSEAGRDAAVGQDSHPAPGTGSAASTPGDAPQNAARAQAAATGDQPLFARDTPIGHGDASRDMAARIASASPETYRRCLSFLQHSAASAIAETQAALTPNQRASLRGIQAAIAAQENRPFRADVAERTNRSLRSLAPEGSPAAGLVNTAQLAESLAETRDSEPGPGMHGHADREAARQARHKSGGNAEL